MPTNNERREVAENLRNMIGYGECRYAEQFYELLKETVMESWDFHEFEDVAGRLADLIEPKERTCRFIEDDELSVGGVRCTVCDEPWFPENDKSRFMYCPKCGTKVVK